MSHERTIRTIRDTLCSVFAQVDAWFARDEALRRFKPACSSDAWLGNRVPPRSQPRAE
jgi:hypothetical protein